MTIKAVVFDVDGVIIKTSRFSERYSKEFGIPIEKVLAYIKNEHKQCLVGKADFRTEISKYVKAWGWKKTLDELVEYWFSGEREPISEMLDLAANLRRKNIKVYLATNQVKDRDTDLNHHLGLDKLFDGMYVSAHVGIKKPDATFFSHILSDLKLNPDEIIFIDDTEENIITAKKTGMHAELFSGFDSFKKTFNKYSLLPIPSAKVRI